MFSRTFVSLVATKKNSTVAVASKKVAQSTAVVPDVSTRFTSTSYVSGKTKSATLFKSPFLDTGALDDIIGVGSKGSKSGASSASTHVDDAGSGMTRKPRRKSPFALINDQEKQAFAKLVSRNMRALKGPSATKLVAANLKQAADTNKGVPNTAKNKDELLLKRHVKRQSNRVRTNSSFYTKPAVRVRKGTFTVDTPTKKEAAPLAKDALNPVNISGSFFTSYERKQYNRLKAATLLLRNPRKVRQLRLRNGLYRFWDKVMDGVAVEK